MLPARYVGFSTRLVSRGIVRACRPGASSAQPRASLAISCARAGHNSIRMTSDCRAKGARRVAGLRREELALLAGVSPDYYVRLEQGRQRPSIQVVEALARALRLNDVETTYLAEVSRACLGARDGWRGPETAQLNLQMLIDQWTTTPA